MHLHQPIIEKGKCPGNTRTNSEMSSSNICSSSESCESCELWGSCEFWGSDIYIKKILPSKSGAKAFDT